MTTPHDGEARNPGKPLSMGGSEIVIAIEDGAFEALAPRIRELATELEALAPLRIVRASRLDDPHRESDFYFDAYRPTTPTCEKVLEFLDGDVVTLFEQETDTGAVYRGRRLVWPSAPLAVASMTGGTTLEPLQDGALYFADGHRIRITTIPNIATVSRQFAVRDAGRGEVIVPDWPERARRDLVLPSQRKN